MTFKNEKIETALVIIAVFLSAQYCFAQSVWEQVTGQKPPIDVKVPTINQVAKDPVKIMVNPMSYINSTVIPTQGDVFEFVIKNPEGAIQLITNPGDWPYIPVATAIISGRNAVVGGGAQPIPDNIKKALRRWYSDELLNSVRWTSNWGLLNNTLQAAQMNFNGRTRAITLINAIVFRDDSRLSDIALWAHELYHVQQYQQWGVFGFAKRWVDNSSESGPVEGPAYDRQEEADGLVGSGQIEVGTNQSAGGFSSASSSTIETAKLPAPWVRCVFPSEPSVNYFVTVDNRILAIPMNGSPRFVGIRTSPRFPGAAWTYQTPAGSFDVTSNGQIWSPVGPFGPMQVGYVTAP